ncbi:MAG: hypothetical protein AMJ69_11210 [Gammaproteobacteria bacterium SG8_47]|nr:MAG: hypothetical protein AMJ69_11210 [Gammaproteobacteria bacterium SG8_47]
MVDNPKRLYLSVALKVMILIGLGFAAVPFVASITGGEGESSGPQPLGGSLDVGLADIAPGRTKVVKWFGRDVWIYRRRPEDIAALPQLNTVLRDPGSGQSRQPDGLRTVYRSAHPEYFVFLPTENIRGCEVSFYPANEPLFADGPWFGGFAERCYGSRYDLAGRVYRDFGDDSQTNLEVPNHWLISETQLRLGEPR